MRKCTDAMRQLTYEICGDSVDDYLRMGVGTEIECSKQFAQKVVECYKDR